jgi:DNA-binding YbaB/EbfC family protein
MDFLKIMKQAQAMQSKMQDLQASLATLTATGQAGAGLVSVTLSGEGALAGVRIDPSLLRPDEAEIIEDLLLAAHADAKAKLDAIKAEKMAEVTGGLSLPPGMKLPF